ncbi:FAD-dependent oxidoreductase [Pseudarthrobacter sp. P1]|uniref:FAD-dependent oxidoreductase n=1 Tax=Pseudarthrobacter sp. P1 TaxID=3418418 RepID=UPI003CF8DF4D
MNENAPRAVVVGFGPVAARLVEELLPAVAAGTLNVTVLGAEPEPAYNRVLVADLGVGRTNLGAITLADPHQLRAAGVDVRLGTGVRRVDRASRRVLLADGGSVGYRWLVFATGSAAVVPNLTGLNPDPLADAGWTGAPLPAGVTSLRDVRDAAVLRAAVEAQARVVVLGGGILGLETALAAAEEGAQVTVVHHGSHLMGRSLDRAGGSLLAATLRRRGVRVAGNARSTGVELAGAGHSFSALLLEGGSAIDGDLLVLSCGVRARTSLASGAGLATGRGILVDHGLRAHHDPDVFAVGDCAEVRCLDTACLPCRGATGPSGLIGPGWRQAEFAAGALLAEAAAGASAGTGSAGAAVPARLAAEKESVILLKARGVDLAAAGTVSADPWDEELPEPHAVPARKPLMVSQWSDPGHGRYVKMSTRAGVLEGFVCVGMPRTAAELVLLFERGSELPADRSSLLRLDGPEQLVDTGAASGPSGPEDTVCRCAGVTCGTITDAVESGCGTVPEVSAATRAGTGCGGCHDTIRGLIERHFAPAAA